MGNGQGVAEELWRQRLVGLSYPDLGATVFPYHVPEGLTEELPGLYGSVFSTLDWFLTQERKVPSGALVLEEPRHVLLFFTQRGTIDVLNRFFVMTPADATRACRALFRAFPQAHRIHLEVRFVPRELALPTQVLTRTDHMVVDLPDTVEAYLASLSKKTRQNLKQYTNRLRRAGFESKTETLPPGIRTQELLERLITWKLARFREKGVETYWEKEPWLSGYSLELLRRCGEAQIVRLGGREAIISFICRAGSGFAGYEFAFDPEFARYSLGTLGPYLNVCNAIDRGGGVFDMLWGTEGYKRQLGARPLTRTLVSVFPSQRERALYVSEAAGVAYRHRADYYWRSRRAAATVVRAVLGRPRPVDEDHQGSDVVAG